MKTMQIWVNPLTAEQRFSTQHPRSPWRQAVVNGVLVWRRQPSDHIPVVHVVPIYENFEWLIND